MWREQTLFSTHPSNRTTMEIEKSVVPEGWELAPSKHRGCCWIPHGRQGAPSTQFRAHSGCRFPSSLKAYPQGASAVLELTHKGGPLACWEGGVGEGVEEDTCRGGRMTV